MSRFARVDSIDRIRDFRVTLARFIEDTKAALAEAESEIAQASRWLSLEQTNYWKLQARKRAELLTRAKIELSRKQSIKTPSGGRYSCVDEKKALALARKRYEEAEQKTANVQRWLRRFEEETFEYKGQVQALMRAIEGDVPKALAFLDRAVQQLDAYTRITPPEGGSRATGEAEYVSVARPVPDGDETPDCRQLRERTPSRSNQDAALQCDDFPAWIENMVVPAEQVEAAADLGTKLEPPPAELRVTVAWTSGEVSGVYLERRKTLTGDDSGWHVGYVDDVTLEGLTACRLGDLLNRRPEWRELLGLPAGYLIALRPGRVMAVFDAEDHIVWPTHPPGVETGKTGGE